MPTKKAVVVDAPVEEPTITNADIAEMRSAEAKMVAVLAAQERRDVYVPKRLFAGSLAVLVNGVRFDYVDGMSHSMPEQIAVLAETRIAAAQLNSPDR